MAKRGFVLLPPDGRLSLIHADDLARLLLALAEPRRPRACWSSPTTAAMAAGAIDEFGRALGKALGRRVADLVDAAADPQPLRACRPAGRGATRPS